MLLLFIQFPSSYKKLTQKYFFRNFPCQKNIVWDLSDKLGLGQSPVELKIFFSGKSLFFLPHHL